MPTALDVSHYSGRLTLDQLRAARDAGVTRLVVGTQDHNIARQQSSVALMLGMEVQAYVFLYFATNTAERVRRDLPLLRAIGATRYWLDAEDAPPGMPADAKVAGLRAAVAAAAGVPHGIYTARWWWTQHAGNTPEFAHLPLWTAQWDGQADLGVFNAYGGWKSAAMKQYRPGTQAEAAAGGVWFPDRTGVWCDVNVYAAALAGMPGVTRRFTEDDAALLWRVVNADPRDDPAGARITPLSSGAQTVTVPANRRGYYVELPL